MAAPTTPIKPPRTLVRVIPFAAQQPFRNAALANGATFVAEFDVGLALTDRNQFLTGAFPGAANPMKAIGPWLDALGFCSGTSSVLVEYAVDLSCAYRAPLPATVLAAATPFNLSGIRITGRFVRVTFTNTSGGAALAEFGVYVRSS